VVIVKADVSEERIASIVRVNYLFEECFSCELTANFSRALILISFMMEAISFSETSVLSRATRRHIQEDGILHSHHRENLKSQ
jgi:hypothetical protein